MKLLLMFVALTTGAQSSLDTTLLGSIQCPENTIMTSTFSGADEPFSPYKRCSPLPPDIAIKINQNVPITFSSSSMTETPSSTASTSDSSNSDEQFTSWQQVVTSLPVETKKAFQVFSFVNGIVNFTGSYSAGLIRPKLQKRDGSGISCPRISNSPPAANNSTDRCAGPRRRIGIFACFCLPKRDNSAETITGGPSANSGSQCLDPSKKYPLAKLLQEPPSTSSSTSTSQPKYSGEEIAKAFLTLYDSIEEIGKGKSGVVYRIRSVDSSQPDRAMKVIYKQPGEHELEVSLIVSEKLVETRKSEAFIRVHDYFSCDIGAIKVQLGHRGAESEGVMDTCLITELVQGGTAAEFIDGNLMSTSSPPDDSVAEFVRSLFFQLFQALKIARETVQFAHLDLNLENILFDRRFTIPVPYMDSRDPYYATGGAKIKIIDYGVSGVTLVRGQPIVSESPFKSEYGSFDFDFWRIYQKLKLRMGQDWWDAIDQETGGKFNELSKIASTAKADPNFYSVILQAPLFAKFL